MISSSADSNDPIEKNAKEAGDARTNSRINDAAAPSTNNLSQCCGKVLGEVMHFIELKLEAVGRKTETEDGGYSAVGGDGGKEAESLATSQQISLTKESVKNVETEREFSATNERINDRLTDETFQDLAQICMQHDSNCDKTRLGILHSAISIISKLENLGVLEKTTGSDGVRPFKYPLLKECARSRKALQHIALLCCAPNKCVEEYKVLELAENLLQDFTKKSEMNKANKKETEKKMKLLEKKLEAAEERNKKLVDDSDATKMALASAKYDVHRSTKSNRQWDNHYCQKVAAQMALDNSQAEVLRLQQEVERLSREVAAQNDVIRMLRNPERNLPANDNDVGPDEAKEVESETEHEIGL